MKQSSHKRLSNIHNFIGEFIQNFIKIEKEIEDIIVNFFSIPEPDEDTKKSANLLYGSIAFHNEEVDSFYRHVVFNERFDFSQKVEYLIKLFRIRGNSYFERINYDNIFEDYFKLIKESGSYRNLLAHNLIQYNRETDKFYILKNGSIDFYYKVEEFKNNVKLVESGKNLKYFECEIREDEFLLMISQLQLVLTFLSILKKNPILNHKLPHSVESINAEARNLGIIVNAELFNTKGIFTFRLNEEQRIALEKNNKSERVKKIKTEQQRQKKSKFNN